MNADSPEGIYVPEKSIVSVSVRLLKPAQHQRPTFSTAIGDSLRQIIPKHASTPIQFSVSSKFHSNSNVLGDKYFWEKERDEFGIRNRLLERIWPVMRCLGRLGNSCPEHKIHLKLISTHSFKTYSSRLLFD